MAGGICQFRTAIFQYRGVAGDFYHRGLFVVRPELALPHEYARSVLGQHLVVYSMDRLWKDQITAVLRFRADTRGHLLMCPQQVSAEFGPSETLRLYVFSNS